MSATFNPLFDAALTPPPESREELVEYDPAVMAANLVEIERRRAAYHRGELATFSREELLGPYLKR